MWGIMGIKLPEWLYTGYLRLMEKKMETMENPCANVSRGTLLSLLGNKLGGRWYGGQLRQQEQQHLNHLLVSSMGLSQCSAFLVEARVPINRILITPWVRVRLLT